MGAGKSGSANAQRKHSGTNRAHQHTAQLVVDPPEVAFVAVAGRPTLAREVTIKNNSDRFVSGVPRLEAQGRGAAFVIAQGHAGFIAPPEHENKRRERVSVKYLAPTAGTHAATLVLPTELGDIHVPLRGQASDIGSHAKTLGDGQGPEPVHDVSDKKPTNRAEGRAQAMEAMDALSSLARTVEATIEPGDAARDHFGAQILSAGASLNTRIVQWVHEEGLDRVEANREDSQGTALDFIKYTAGKMAGATLKALSKENILTAYALEAIDLGLSVYFGRKANQDVDRSARGYEQHMSDVMGMAIPATDAATKALALRFASLMSEYAMGKSNLLRLAGDDAQHELGKLRDALASNRLDDLASRTADARQHLQEFRAAQREWGQALKQIAASGNNAQSVVNAGFHALIEKYVEFRAAGNREIADHERTVVCRARIDFDEPWNIQHTGFTFGKLNDPGSTVGGHIDRKRLAEVGSQRGNPPRPGWAVDIRITDVSSRGAIVLKQGPAGAGDRQHKFEGGIEARVQALGGIERVWSALDSVTLGTRVIWGGKR